MNTTTQALMDFIDSALAKGRLNKNTGGSIRVACRKILEQVKPEDDVRHVDVAAEVLQYNNRHPNELSADSLRVYESRVKTAIDTFIQSLTDPTGYKLPGKAGATRNGKNLVRRTSSRDDKARPLPEANTAAPTGPHPLQELPQRKRVWRCHFRYGRHSLHRSLYHVT